MPTLIENKHTARMDRVKKLLELAINDRNFVKISQAKMLMSELGHRLHLQYGEARQSRANN